MSKAEEQNKSDIDQALRVGDFALRAVTGYLTKSQNALAKGILTKALQDVAKKIEAKPAQEES